jgi:hypothetical protein
MTILVTFCKHFAYEIVHVIAELFGRFEPHASPGFDIVHTDLGSRT